MANNRSRDLPKNIGGLSEQAVCLEHTVCSGKWRNHEDILLLPFRVFSIFSLLHIVLIFPFFIIPLIFIFCKLLIAF